MIDKKLLVLAAQIAAWIVFLAALVVANFALGTWHAW